MLSGEGAEKAPAIEGNVQILSAYECGDKVISCLHTPDGNLVGNGNSSDFEDSCNVAGTLPNEKCLDTEKLQETVCVFIMYQLL